MKGPKGTAIYSILTQFLFNCTDIWILQVSLTLIYIINSEFWFCTYQNPSQELMPFCMLSTLWAPTDTQVVGIFYLSKTCSFGTQTEQCWLLLKLPCHSPFSSPLTRELRIILLFQEIENSVVCISWESWNFIFQSLADWLTATNTESSAVLAGASWSSSELFRYPGLFFQPDLCLNCEVSGQEYYLCL